MQKNKPYILGVTFARGGSKGIPGKNIKSLAGKPLLVYAIETAQKVLLLDHYIISTDDKEIANIAKKHGVEVPFMRPQELAQDNTPEWLAWRHAIHTFQELRNKKVDVLISIPTTSPLRLPQDVSSCIETLLKENVDAVITTTESDRNPYFNMVTLSEDGYARPVIALENITNRQTAPTVYAVTTVAYAVRAPFVLEADRMFDGKVKTIFVPKERALDIDTELDWQFVEFLLQQGKK